MLERRAQPEPVQPLEADPEVTDAIARLSPSQRAAVVLFYYEDRPVGEIADILDCSEPTARVHLHKARRRLAKLLGDEVLDAS